MTLVIGTRKRRHAVIALSAGFLLAMTACSSAAIQKSNTGASSTPSGSGATSSSTPYTITMNGDRSGQFAAAGTADQDGFQTYMAAVNANGGINGHHITVQTMDDHSDVTTGLANYEQAISSSSLAFLEITASAVMQAVAERAQKDGIVVSSPGGFNGGTGVYPYVYNTGPTVPDFLSEVETFAAEKAGDASGAKAAFIGYDSALTETYNAPLKAGLKAKGITLAYSQLVPITTVDMALTAANIAAVKPAVVIAALQDGAQATSLVQGLRSNGYTGPIINFNSNLSGATMKKLNDKQFYIVQYTADPTDTGNSAVRQMQAQAQKYGFTKGNNLYFFVLGYELARVVAAAIQKCGNDCTRSTFNTALQSTSIDGAGLMAGQIGFTPQSHVIVSKLVIDQWDGAKGYLTQIPGFGF